MNLIGEQFVQNKVDNSKKWKTLVLVLIIVVIICIIAIIVSIFLLKEKPLIANLNGQESDELKEILRFEENGKIYIPIRKMSNILGYKSYNGNYANRSEDINECYSEVDEEVSAFLVNSNRIEKIDINDQKVTYFYIDEPVQMIDGDLYTTKEGIEKAFNLKFNYDVEAKTITVETMQYLMDEYKGAIIEAGYDDVSIEFDDEKAILEDLVIVKKEDQNGIFNITTDEEILETKYSEIKYIPMSGDFLVSNNEKIGIKTNTGKDKIKMQYDSIELINQDLKLYVVKKDDKYGVINQNENVIIPINCDEIGVDIQAYKNNNLKNKYIILDKIIPVMKDDRWGLYDIEGNQLTGYNYEQFGCNSSSARNSDNVLVIPDYNVIIACRNNKYYLLNQYGERLFNGVSFDEVYMIKELENTNYYAIREEKRYDVIKLLERLNEKNQSKDETDSDEE